MERYEKPVYLAVGKLFTKKRSAARAEAKESMLEELRHEADRVVSEYRVICECDNPTRLIPYNHDLEKEVWKKARQEAFDRRYGQGYYKPWKDYYTGEVDWMLPGTTPWAMELKRRTDKILEEFENENKN
jgi:hypothetical protein